MRCVCGVESTSKAIADLNQHRRTCNAFWQAVYGEMRRIALDTYGRPIPISQSDWNQFRNHDFPSREGMRRWSPSWPEIQKAAGLGVSSRGKGAIIQHGRVALGAADSNKALDDIALSIFPVTTSVESYLAQTMREGLLICEQTYQRTGRMILR